MISRRSTALAAALSISIASGAQALDGPGRALVASNTLRLAADTPRSGVSVSKEFIVPYAGVVRVRWQAKSDGQGTIILNVDGAAGNCTQPISATIFQHGKCDLHVVAGDHIRVSVIGVSTGTVFPIGSLKGVRLYWNVVNSTGHGTVLLN